MDQQPKQLEEPYCPDCGSANVCMDAFASWNAETQDWELHSMYDNGWCQDCGNEEKHGFDWRVVDSAVTVEGEDRE